MKEKVDFDTSEHREVCRGRSGRTSPEFGLDGVSRVELKNLALNVALDVI